MWNVVLQGQEAGSVGVSSVENARFVRFGGAALGSDDNQGDARARTPLDPVVSELQFFLLRNDYVLIYWLM